MKTTFYAVACTLIFLGAGCGSAQAPASTTTVPVANPQAKTYSLSDVAMHATSTDCWMAISGKVYDVTSYRPNHPGGDKMAAGCGKDATAMFNGIKGGKGHSDYAKSLQTDYYVGDLK
ncbi:MAG: cytochrome b5-like heme/steroid binding domain-containing protein [Patescibacteria group bacterium]